MAPRKTDKVPPAPERIVVAALASGDTIGIPKAWLEAFMPGQGIEYTQNGVVLCSERQKHTIKIGDTPVVATISLYVTREPVGQEEVNAVAAVKDQRTTDKKRKDIEAAEQLAKEKRTMFELGQQSSSQAIMGTLSNIAPLMNAAKTLKNAFPDA
jgi:hypothetical protein